MTVVKVLWNTMGYRTALTRLCGTLWDITYDSPRKVLWNTKKTICGGTLWDIIMTALRRFSETLQDITYDSPKKVLCNTMGHNL